MTLRTVNRFGLMLSSLKSRTGVATLITLAAIGVAACASTWSTRATGKFAGAEGELELNYDGSGSKTLKVTVNGTNNAPNDIQFLKNGQPNGALTTVPNGSTVTIPEGSTEVVISCPGTPPPASGLVLGGTLHTPERASKRIAYSVHVRTLDVKFEQNATNVCASFIVHERAGRSAEELWGVVKPVVLGGPGTQVASNVEVDSFVTMTPVSGGARLSAADTGHFTRFRLRWNGHDDYATLVDMTNVALTQWDNGWEVASTFIPFNDFDLSGALNGCLLDVVNDEHPIYLDQTVEMVP